MVSLYPLFLFNGLSFELSSTLKVSKVSIGSIKHSTARLDNPSEIRLRQVQELQNLNRNKNYYVHVIHLLAVFR